MAGVSIADCGTGVLLDAGKTSVLDIVGFEVDDAVEQPSSRMSGKTTKKLIFSDFIIIQENKFTLVGRSTFVEIGADQGA
jgi:hypothetical protein